MSRSASLPYSSPAPRLAHHVRHARANELTLLCSVSIMADAAHMFSDVLSFLISAYCTHLISKRTTMAYTFGYHRAETVGALVSVLIVCVLTGSLVLEAVQRLINPTPINGKLMFIIAVVGIGFNLLLLLTLGHEHHHHAGGSCGGHGHSHDHGHAHAHGDHGQGGCGGHAHAHGQEQSEARGGGCGHSHIEGGGAAAHSHDHSHDHGGGAHGHGGHEGHELDASQLRAAPDAAAPSTTASHGSGHACGHADARGHSVTIELRDGHAAEVHEQGALPRGGAEYAAIAPALAMPPQSALSHSQGGHGEHGEDSQNQNMRGAVLHVMGDLVQSVGVALAGAIIWCALLATDCRKEPIFNRM